MSFTDYGNILFLCACQKGDDEITESVPETTRETEEPVAVEKDYDLSVDEDVKEEAESDCKKVMGQIREIYLEADDGEASNTTITEDTAEQILIALQETGYPASCSRLFCNMVNYQALEQFLQDVSRGNAGAIVTYQVHLNGGISRSEFVFDGTNMYVLDTRAIWNEKNEPYITATSYTKIKKWEFTKKGWFIYECYVPEPPEVSEVVNGYAMLRVKPLREEYREMAKKYLYPIGYQGNNLLCSNWSAGQMEDIDYNGLFEYLYKLGSGQEFDVEAYASGIPREEFEQLMTGYLPVTPEQLEQYARYDRESQTYAWERLGCLSYAPNSFGTSVPEITGITENKDGSITLTVDAVCEMLGNDAVMTHKLTIEPFENGNMRYLKNEIQEDGLQRIPGYQYRLGNK